VWIFICPEEAGNVLLLYFSPEPVYRNEANPQLTLDMTSRQTASGGWMMRKMSKSTKGCYSFIQDSDSNTLLQILDVERANAFLEIRFRGLISVVVATVENR
jgi:hypothetical protein